MILKQVQLIERLVDDLHLSVRLDDKNRVLVVSVLHGLAVGLEVLGKRIGVGPREVEGAGLIARLLGQSYLAILAADLKAVNVVQEELDDPGVGLRIVV